MVNLSVCSVFSVRVRLCLSVADCGCEIARLRNDVDSFRYLRIVRRDEHAIAHDTPVRGGDHIEPQFHFDKRPIAIDDGGCSLVVRVARHEVAICLVDRVSDFELALLKFVLEIDRRCPVRLETANTSIHEFTRESEDRTQQTTLRQISSARSNALVRRDATAAVNRAAGIGLTLRTSRLRRFFGKSHARAVRSSAREQLPAAQRADRAAEAEPE